MKAAFEEFEALQKKRLTELLRNMLSGELELYLDYLKDQAKKIPPEDDTEGNIFVSLKKQRNKYVILPVRRLRPSHQMTLIIYYDELEKIINQAIEDIRNGEADGALMWTVEETIYNFAEAYLKLKKEEAEP